MTTTIQQLSYEAALARIDELETELQRVKQNNQRLIAFQRISEQVSASLNIEQVLRTILHHIRQVVYFDSATLMLVEGDQLRAVAADGFAVDPPILNLYPRSSQNSAWRVVDSKAPLVIDDVSVTENWESRHGLEQIRAWLGIPLIVKDQVIGVLTLDAHRPNLYSVEDAQLVTRLGYQVAIAVENASLFETIKAQHERMSKLQELNQAIASILDLDTLLQTAVRQTTAMLGSHWCSLWLFDEDGHYATATASFSHGRDHSDRLGLTIDVGEHPIIGQMLVRDKPLIINEFDPYLQSTLLAVGHDEAPILAMPLRYQEQNIGFMIIDNTERREAYLSHRLALAMSVANQAALAIGAAKLFDELQKQADRLRLINDVARQITTILNVDDLLSILAQVIHERLDYAVVTIFSVDEGAGEAVLKAVTGRSPSWLLPEVHRQSLSTGAIGAVAHSGRPLLIRDARSLPEQFLIAGADYLAGVVIPIYINAHLEAFITVQNELAAAFNEHDVWTLETLGQQAAIAIENARLFRQIQNYSQDLEEAVTARTKHLRTVNETSRAISSILSMDSLFDNVTRLISRLFNQARVSLALQIGNHLIFQKVCPGEFEVDPIPDNHRLLIREAGVAGDVVSSGQARFVAAVSTADLYQLAEADSLDSAAFIVPLTTTGKTIGVIIVQMQANMTSEGRDMETLQSLASQVAVAIENVRLLEKTREMVIVQERARLARDMHDGVAQNLAYLLLQVDRCLTMAETNSPKLIPELENMGQVIRQNIEELRRHIFDLRPLGLKGRSIFQVLRQMLDEFGRQTNIKTTCHIVGDERPIPSQIEASLYRVFQEALSNIRRHARCKQVEVVVTIQQSGSLQLRIQDDGQGFDSSDLERNPLQRHGLGLVSMEERVRSLGGSFVIRSRAGQGTTIEVTLPNLLELEATDWNKP